MYYRSNCDESEPEQNMFCGISQMDDLVEKLFIDTRRIMIVGEIDSVVSAHICGYLQLLSLHSDPIYMYIDSPGGHWSAGYAIIDQMLMCQCPIHTIIRGQGCSMGAVIAAFGSPGKRHATANASIMLHTLMANAQTECIQHNIIMFDYLKRDYEQKIGDLARRMKLSKRQLIKLLDETRWLTPTQAIDIGLIDSIWTKKMEDNVNKRLKS